MSSGGNVLGGKCPGGNVLGGKCPRGEMPGGGNVRGGGERPGGKRPGGKRPRIARSISRLSSSGAMINKMSIAISTGFSPPLSDTPSITILNFFSLLSSMDYL